MERKVRKDSNGDILGQYNYTTLTAESGEEAVEIFLIATGYSANGKVKETLEAGAAGFVGKPYRLIDMVKKIREVLSFN